MTKPIEFEGQTEVLPITRRDAGPLPVYKLQIEGHLPLMLSCWRLSLKDRLRALWTGCVWVGLLSDSPPPLSVSMESPLAE